MESSRRPKAATSPTTAGPLEATFASKNSLKFAALPRTRKGQALRLVAVRLVRPATQVASNANTNGADETSKDSPAPLPRHTNTMRPVLVSTVNAAKVLANTVPQQSSKTFCQMVRPALLAAVPFDTVVPMPKEEAGLVLVPLPEAARHIRSHNVTSPGLVVRPRPLP